MKMIDIYAEFGINIHIIPREMQSSLNAMVSEIIKLRNKKVIRKK
jgi:hypothetical protein